MQRKEIPKAACALWPHTNTTFMCFIVNSLVSFWSSSILVHSTGPAGAYFYLQTSKLHHLGRLWLLYWILLILKKSFCASLYINCGGPCASLLVIGSSYHFRIRCRIEWQSANEVRASRVLLISPEPQQCNRLQRVFMKSFAVLPSSYLYKWKFLCAAAKNTIKRLSGFEELCSSSENKMGLLYAL